MQFQVRLQKRNDLEFQFKICLLLNRDASSSTYIVYCRLDRGGEAEDKAEAGIALF